MKLSSERVVVIRNPATSHAKEVQRGVVDRLRDSSLSPGQFTEFWTPSADREETTEALAHFIQPGDRLIVAAGDGTGNAAMNAFMQADTDGVQLGFLPYGNFNDMASTFTARTAQRDPLTLLDRSQPVDVHPLRVNINGEHARFALLYATLGWTAVVAATFDQPETRRSLQRGRANLAASLFDIAKMYVQTRHSASLPPFFHDGDPDEHRHTTDMLAINGPIMAKIIRTNLPLFSGRDFLRHDLDVSTFFANHQLLGRSGLNLVAGTTFALPGVRVPSETLQFAQASLPLQLDGEFSQLENVTSLSITKDQSPSAKTVTVLQSTTWPTSRL